MIKFRLLRLLNKGARYVLLEIIWQWLELVSQIIIIGCVARTISGVFYNIIDTKKMMIYLGVALFAIFSRLVFDRLYTEASFEAGVEAKKNLRDEIYSKLLRLGSGYRQHVSSAQITQMMGEGVEQLDVYFGKYISQFVYSLLAPVTLFLVLSRYNSKIAAVLLVAVPFMPAIIMALTKAAQKLSDKYMESYYSFGDTFLEKLHGLTTLKVYNADEKAAEDLDEECQDFRKISMKVLSLQLFTTFALDLITYVGTAVGIVFTINEYLKGNMELEAAIMFLILAAEFFLPLRLLGVYFQIGMNGIKAADKIFAFLDIKEPAQGKQAVTEGPYNIAFRNASFTYKGISILSDLTFDVPEGKLISLVGVSGSGKSSIANLLRRQIKGYDGSISINGKEIKSLNENALMAIMTAVAANSFLFPGTVRDNLLLGNSKSSDKKLNGILKLMNLQDELNPKGGLNFILEEGGKNLSAGQRQRLLVARALLKNTPIYVFDEVTNNIDVESEDLIVKVIKQLSKEMGKTVILITHRLENAVMSDEIFLLTGGSILEHGTHNKLMEKGGRYAALYKAQKALENYPGGEVS
ncbi:MAG: ABC transporter ATP-binding protein/permease [Pseudobutyrivibrio sp.]|nr:ABC transporter ATP-binding protein/permease [Pseudobutyrivibrio sp.]